MGMGMKTVNAKIGQTETDGQIDALESLPQRRRANNVTVLTYTANGIIAPLPSLQSCLKPRPPPSSPIASVKFVTLSNNTVPVTHHASL
jgi:hypothetical protein